MAAARPRAHLDHLPGELLLDIIEQHSLSRRDLISLARTNHRYHNLILPAVYEAHVKDERGIAIYWAIENDQYATLERLIDHGVDVNMLDRYGNSLNIADTLAGLGGLKYQWADVFDCESQISPLALAAFHGRNSMVELLLDNGANREQPSTALCECSSFLLRCPSRISDPPEFLEASTTDHGGDHGGDHEGDDDGDDDEDDDKDHYAWSEGLEVDSAWKPLHYAICQGNFATAKLLIERGASADDVGDDVSALMIATRWGFDEIIEYLFDNKLASIDSETDNGVTALHVAYVGGRHDLVNDYLDRGADINMEFIDDWERGPWTLMSMACADGDFEQALQYLRRGAEPNFRVGGGLCDEPWTTKKFIRRSEASEILGPILSDDDPRRELEREIIAGEERLQTHEETASRSTVVGHRNSYLNPLGLVAGIDMWSR